MALLRHHIQLNGAATIVLGVLVIAWLGASDRIRERAHFAYLLVLLVAVGLIAAGAWHGGEMVYAHATGTHLVKGGWPTKTQGDATESKPAAGEKPAPGKWAFDALRIGDEQTRRFDDTADIHIQFAGIAAALAVVTIGLSLRGLWLDPNAASSDDPQRSDDDIVNALAGRGEQRSLLRENLASVPTPARVPAARFWLLAALVGIVTALLGYALLGMSSMPELIKTLKDCPRYMAHSIAGGSIVVLTLILALVTRFAPYNRVLVGGFSLLLALALAAQVWLGILLLYDTNVGPIQHFNAPTTQSSVT